MNFNPPSRAPEKAKLHHSLTAPIAQATARLLSATEASGHRESLSARQCTYLALGYGVLDDAGYLSLRPSAINEALSRLETLLQLCCGWPRLLASTRAPRIEQHISSNAQDIQVGFTSIFHSFSQVFRYLFTLQEDGTLVVKAGSVPCRLLFPSGLLLPWQDRYYHVGRRHFSGRLRDQSQS